jgi:hypothetical protein
MSIETNSLHHVTLPGPAKPGSALHSFLVVPAHSPLTPLGHTLTKNALNFSNRRRVTPLESIRSFAKSFRAYSYEDCQYWHRSATSNSFRISRRFLLSPLESTLTQNPPVSPLESTLTKSTDLKSHRIKLLQERGEWGVTVSGSVRATKLAASVRAGVCSPSLPRVSGEPRSALPASACLPMALLDPLLAGG